MANDLLVNTIEAIEEEIQTVNTWLQTRLGMDYEDHILYKEYMEKNGNRSNFVLGPVECKCGNVTEDEENMEECPKCSNLEYSYNLLNRLENFKEWLEDNHVFN